MLQDLWAALEEHTRAWRALDRQSVADAIWADYVAARFARTGDARALQFLYPYLNRADAGGRQRAIAVAGMIFEGRGPQAVEALDYFTRNTDPFLRDRAVQVVAAAVAGHPEEVILATLRPYLDHPSRFIRRLSVTALGRAGAASGGARLLAEAQRVAQTCATPPNEVQWTAARIFRGRPSEEAYALLARVDAPGEWRGSDHALGLLLGGATDEWYERGCREVFEPRLHVALAPAVRYPAPGWSNRFTARAAVEGLCRAGLRRGYDSLRRALHLRSGRCTGYALLKSLPLCFAGADAAANRTPLLALARTGDVQAQALAATGLGCLLKATEDAEVLALLKEMCQAHHGAVRCAALRALGLVAQSSCDDELRKLCEPLTDAPETACAAVTALGGIFAGSGRSDVFEYLREKADGWRQRPVRGRKHCRPLTECYLAVGRLYQGTGSVEPMDFLVQALAPSPVRWCTYRWAAGRALVEVEFSESVLARARADTDWS